MKKRMLITATDLMAVQFLVPHVEHLIACGWQISLACSEVGGRFAELAAALPPEVALHKVSLRRSPFSVTNLRGLRQLKKQIEPGKYDVIWTNEPVMGVMTRLAARPARKAGAKVLYMCHGFHFFRGCMPLLWLFYPVEKYMSRHTDVLVTLNREDEARGKKLHAGAVAYIPGMGVDTARLMPRRSAQSVRSGLGLRDGDVMVLSVGELNKNKNHAVILRALAKLQDPAVHYVLCGTGPQRTALERLARRLGLEGQVHFAGYCREIGEYLHAADMFAFPSRREGLSLAVLEAMTCGLPLAASAIRGVEDFAAQGKSGFLCRPWDVDGFAVAIRQLAEDVQLRRRCGDYNRSAVVGCDLTATKIKVEALFEGIAHGN